MKARIDSLNFIRILGMTMILLFHAWLLYGFSTGISWLDEKISVGAIFVTVFFMLSGFGLRKSNGTLALGDRQSVLRFYKKRVVGIYPLFLILTLVALLFQFRMADSWGETLLRLPVQFSMLHILFGKEMHGFLFNDNCWYISALFVLYLLFPLFNALVSRLQKGIKVWLCAGLWIISVLVYAYFVYGTELTFLDYYPHPFLRIPEFGIGMLLADLSQEISWSKRGRAIALALVLVLATICLTLLYPHFKNETNLYNVIVIPCAAVIFISFSGWDELNRIGGKLVIKWLAGLGLEMYLCQSFATLILTKVRVPGAVDELWFIGLTVVIAVVVNTFFTRPIIKKARE